MKHFYMVLAGEELDKGCLEHLMIPPCKTLTGAIDGLHINKQQDISLYLENNRSPRTYRVYEVKEVNVFDESNNDIGYNEI